MPGMPIQAVELEDTMRRFMNACQVFQTAISDQMTLVYSKHLFHEVVPLLVKIANCSIVVDGRRFEYCSKSACYQRILWIAGIISCLKWIGR